MISTSKLEVLILFILFQFSLFAQSLPEITNDSFTITVMSDTQGYEGKGAKSTPDSEEAVRNEVLDSQTNWLIGNYKKQNIIFVSHAGDVVDINNPSQWDVALNHLNRIHGIIPYAISLGNHDMESNGNSELFQSYFPEKKFSSFDWYGGSYENNTSSYQLLSSNNVDLLLLHIECNAPDSVLGWADDVLTKYKDRFVIVVTHMFLGPSERPINPEDYFDKPKGIMKWHKTFGKRGNTPEQLWNKCFKKHDNIQLIISGDQSRTNAMYKKYIGEKGNIVHALLDDYSSHSGGGLRLYRFSPLNHKIEVITYNTTDDKLVDQTKIVPQRGEHLFTIPFNYNSKKKN